MSKWEFLQYTEEQRETILKEYNRTPSNIKDDVNAIREWIKSQPHLPQIMGKFILI